MHRRILLFVVIIELRLLFHKFFNNFLFLIFSYLPDGSLYFSPRKCGCLSIAKSINILTLANNSLILVFNPA